MSPLPTSPRPAAPSKSPRTPSSPSSPPSASTPPPPRAVRDALEAHELAQRGRLLPPTVVLCESGKQPPPGLPEGTVLRVDTEDGRSLAWDGGEPLPLGTHVLRAQAPRRTVRRHAADRRPAAAARTPERGHGFLVQLYSLLSARSWGMGDLGDLAELAAWSGRAFGSDFVQVNPLHAAVPGLAHRPLALPPLLPPLPRPGAPARRGDPRIRLPHRPRP
ncbi:hypothetical protein GCM10020000_54130 [Streptomyces olivoverticillatus]